MKNPYARRWNNFSYGEPDRFEAQALRAEAQEAEDTPTETCGKCGATAYYRPGVGAHQCPSCRSVRVAKYDQKTGQFTQIEWR